MFCLVSVWLIPPVVYASGLHQTRRSAYGLSAKWDVRLQILRVGADRCVRPRLTDFPLVLSVGLHGVFGYKSSA